MNCRFLRFAYYHFAAVDNSYRYRLNNLMCLNSFLDFPVLCLRRNSDRLCYCQPAHFEEGCNMFALRFDLADNNPVFPDRRFFHYQNRSLLFVSFFIDRFILLWQLKHKFSRIFVFTLRINCAAVHFNHHLYYI